MADEDNRAELNRLYWESSESVAGIADRLNVSRRALYDSIDPRPAGVPCPECGAPLGFRNRMALEGGEAECPACGHQETVPREAPSQPGSRPPEPGPLHSGPPPEPIGRPPIRRRPASSGTGLGVALVTGLGLGALVAYVLKRS